MTKMMTRLQAIPGQLLPKNMSEAKAKKYLLKAIIMTLRYILMISLGVMILYPLMRMISVLFTHPRALGLVGAVWVPPRISFDHLQIAWGILDPARTLSYTFVHVSGLVVLSTLSAAFAGYAFARLKFRGMGLLFMLVLITFIIPNEVFTLPHQIMFRNFDVFGIVERITGEPLNLLGQSTVMYLMAGMGMGIAGGLFIYIFRQFYRGLPKELEEAAYVDGAGVTRTFLTIVLPMAKPAFFTVGTLSFIWNYNDTHFPGLFNPTLDNIRMRLQAIHTVSGGRSTISQWVNHIARGRIPITAYYVWGNYGNAQADAAILTISTLLSLLPLIILFLIIQRQFVQGVERSGIVG